MSSAAFDRDGFTSVAAVLSAHDAERAAGQVQLEAGAGTRCLLDQPWCAAIAHAVRQAMPDLIGAGLVAVQCTWFEKSAGRNWLVPLHQDLSIPVHARNEHPSLSGWSRKEGRWFVRAPVDVLEQLVAVRVHLDPCPAQDGPLRIVPQSHRNGILSQAAIDTLRASAGEVVCTAQAGDALVMRPLLLHASSRSTGNGRRRVLHFVFGPRTLPCGLRWHSALEASATSA